MSAPRLPTRQEALQILVQRANAGNKRALVGLREVLDNCPEIWATLGDLGRHAEMAWMQLMSGGDLLVIESVKRQLAHMKAELTGRTPSALEQLLTDQIGITWLAVRHAEVSAARQGGTLGEAALRLKRAESAARRHLMAVKTLATVRALGATTPRKSGAVSLPGSETTKE